SPTRITQAPDLRARAERHPLDGGRALADRSVRPPNSVRKFACDKRKTHSSAPCEFTQDVTQVGRAACRSYSAACARPMDFDYGTPSTLISGEAHSPAVRRCGGIHVC